MRTGEMVVYDSIAQSNLPRGQKSAVMSFLDRNLGGLTKHAAGFGSALTSRRRGAASQGMIRQNAESFAFGAMLGTVNSTIGLDAGAKKNIPIDVGVAAASLLGAYLLRSYGVATELTNLAATGFSVFGFRKGSALLGSAKTLVTRSKVAGDDDEDPICRAAQEL
jgi:hypothetical protein